MKIAPEDIARIRAAKVRPAYRDTPQGHCADAIIEAIARLAEALAK